MRAVGPAKLVIETGYPKVFPKVRVIARRYMLVLQTIYAQLDA